MRFLVKELVWPEPIVEKIQRKHGVTPAEVEELFFQGGPHFRVSGDLIYAFGQTQSGKYLFVVFRELSRRRAQIITAREMDETEKRYYKKRRR